MIVFAVILVSVILVSLISFVGLIAFAWKEEELKPFLLVLVSFAAGALLGDVFLHLFPAIGNFRIEAMLMILGGILAFFILEKFICWRHCHTPVSHHAIHPFAFTNLVGDSIHNFIDGVLIAGSYLVSLPLGFATTIAVALHEIPQEISDFAILLHAGMHRKKAIFFNFISAATAILGALLTFFIGKKFENLITYLIPFTIGGFIYIAAADLIPEVHREKRFFKSLVQLLAFILGIFVMALFLLLE